MSGFRDPCISVNVVVNIVVIIKQHCYQKMQFPDRKRPNLLSVFVPLNFGPIIFYLASESFGLWLLNFGS